VLRQREDAEDVAQEALIRAHRRIGSLREPERLRPWLVRVTWRLALDHRRTAARRRRRELGARHAAAPDPEAAYASRERIWSAIDALPDKLRLVVILSGIEGHDIREIAAILGLPEGTVKSRLHLARRRMLEALE
jgi:RNA polymerase sigma-70 factor (ECF subfamily)